jgi:hypothetical protein
MDQRQPMPSSDARSETDERRQTRLRREAALIAEAVAELDRGEGVALDDLRPFLDAFVRGNKPPLPEHPDHPRADRQHDAGP